MNKFKSAFQNREKRKKLIALLYRILTILLLIFFVILPVIGSVVTTILVIADELQPIALVSWAATVVLLLLYFLVFILVTINYGFYLDNADIAQKYVGNCAYLGPVEETADQVEVADQIAVAEPKYKLTRAYKVPQANNAVIPANSEVEYLEAHDGKVKISCNINGKKYTLFVLSNDVQLIK